jgi:hypothetical protein
VAGSAEAISDAYALAVWQGDYAAADRVLADSPLAALPESASSVISDPIAFHRAYLAHLRADPAASRWADQAIAYYRNGTWNDRQRPWTQMRIAQAEAWAGRGPEALRDARAAYADVLARDAYDAVAVHGLLGTVLVAAGRTDEALECLRGMMNGPGTSPNGIRADPLWSRLKDDPRFEEILRSAKPL